MTNSGNDQLHVLPVGGLGEIGLNMMIVVLGNDAFIIDAGIMFPDESMPGVDIVIPDLEAALKEGWNIHGIVITHGHEDHIGALPYLLRKIAAPLFASGFTMGLIEYKLEEFGLLQSTTRHLISTEAPIDLGPFHIEFFAVCHSIADSMGLAVSTSAGMFIHSGDFKLDPTPIDGRLCDLEKLALYARNDVLALFSDSTNVERKGTTRSESAIRPAFEQIFREAAGRIMIATFSSNIHRMQQVMDLAHEFGRKVVLVGRSMAANARIASERGYLNIPQGILVDLKDVETLPDEKATILSTGSQGEPMSAFSLMAFDRHKYLKVKPGDLVVLSSRFIPGNEKAINVIINEFFRRGANVLHEKISDVHVSGHASEEELRYLIRLVRPRCFIPVHGEYRHLLRHARVAIEEGMPPERVLVAQDGDYIELSSDGPTVVRQFDVGRIFVHGKGVGDIGHDVLRDRRVMSEVGLITVVVVVDGDTEKLICGPEVSSVGVTFEDIEPELMEGARTALEERLAELNPTTLQQWEDAREEIRLTVRRHIKRVLGRKPLIQTLILTP